MELFYVFQIAKNHYLSSVTSCLGKWFCCVMKKSIQKETNKNLTMETKVMNDEDVATAATIIIDCVNDTKLSSMHATKQPGTENLTSFYVLKST